MAVLTLRAVAVRLLLIVLLAAASRLHAQTLTMEEYRLKAAFLSNFAQFVEWSPEAFMNASEPINICVLGRNPFGSTLHNAVRGKVVATRTLAVREIRDAKQVASCHILFISAAEQERSGQRIAELKSSNVLTVGETDRFVATGRIMSFRVRDSRIRFEIDASAASAAKLSISSKLLSLAENTRNLKHN
jgi:hypothetical protein